MTTTHITLDGPEFGPEERYRIYERLRPTQGPADIQSPTRASLVATCPTPEAVGVALCQLAEDRWEAGDHSTPVVGVLDGERGRWISGLWLGGGLA